MDIKRLRTDDHLQHAWLFELHSKIWGRQDLVGKLSYKLEITAAHYFQLQKRLDHLYPNRSSEDYWNGNVLSTKLNILQSVAPPPVSSLIPVMSTGGEGEQIEGEQIEVDGMDDELRAFFPATVEYLDLSSLELKKPPPRIPLPLLIRKEYHIITNMLNKLPQGNAGSVIISGQPGTGETLILLYLP